MKILTGDELGQIKLVDINKQNVLSKFGEIKKGNGIVGIDSISNDNSILGISHEKNFYVLNWNKFEIMSQPEISLGESINITSQIIKKTIDFSSVVLSRSDNQISVLQYDDEINMKNKQDIQIKTNKLHSIKSSVNTNEIFCLFKDSPICIFNLEKNQISWKAKNVPNDVLNLVCPMWDIDVVTSQQNSHLIYAATAYGQIRTYDKKVKAVPVNDKQISEKKITRMTQSPCDNYLTIGDCIGNIYMLDKRKSIFH